MKSFLILNISQQLLVKFLNCKMASGSEQIIEYLYIQICTEYLEFERDSLKSLDKFNNQIRRLFLPLAVLSSPEILKKGIQYILLS